MKILLNTFLCYHGNSTNNSRTSSIFPTAGLLGNNILHLPLNSLNLGYKQEKVTQLTPACGMHKSQSKQGRSGMLNKLSHRWSASWNTKRQLEGRSQVGLDLDGVQALSSGHQPPKGRGMSLWSLKWPGKRRPTRFQQSASSIKEGGLPGKWWPTEP